MEQFGVAIGVIFDDQHSTLSQLEYAVSNFMSFETTKELVDRNFIVAIVPAASASELVPEDDPLETARWTVLAPDGTTVATETVYANPEEGLKRVRRVLSHWEDIKKAAAVTNTSG